MAPFDSLKICCIQYVGVPYTLDESKTIASGLNLCKKHHSYFISRLMVSINDEIIILPPIIDIHE